MLLLSLLAADPPSTFGGRLKLARKASGLTQKQAAAKAGMSQGTLSDLENDGSTSSTYTARLAHLYGVNARWLDDGEGVPALMIAEESPQYGERKQTSRVPVAGTAQLGENGWYEEVHTLGSEGYVETHSSDPDAYALRVRGDSMFPAIRDGWYVVVEPNSTASSGEYVAIALQDGRKMVKEYLFGNDESVSVQSVNGGTRLTLSTQEILAIHAIGAVLMPSKHRDI